jgi:hypothetical protein
VPTGKNPSKARAPKVATSATKPRTRRQVSSAKKRPKPSFSSVESWDKVVRNAPWVSQQASSLNPGSSAAVSRRRNTPKYVARTKRVIRPRVKKRNMV